MSELYRPPKKRTMSSTGIPRLKDIAMDTVVEQIRKKGPSQKFSASPPLIRQQIGRQLKRWHKRSVRQQRLYQDYTGDIVKYFDDWKQDPHRVPLYLFSLFSRLITTEIENSTVTRFMESKRRFQKVASVDPSQYQQGTGKYSIYLVKYNNEIYLSVYDYENSHIFCVCLE